MRSMQTTPVDTGGFTGWAALDDTMKKRDEQTAKDHMSDIDTLLVFVRISYVVPNATHLIDRRPVCILRC